MWQCLLNLPPRFQRLGQTKTKKFILRLALDQRRKLFDARGHGYTASMKITTPVALSGPPRRTARPTISSMAPLGSACLSMIA